MFWKYLKVFFWSTLFWGLSIAGSRRRVEEGCRRRWSYCPIGWRVWDMKQLHGTMGEDVGRMSMTWKSHWRKISPIPLIEVASDIHSNQFMNVEHQLTWAISMTCPPWLFTQGHRRRVIRARCDGSSKKISAWKLTGEVLCSGSVSSTFWKDESVKFYLEASVRW